MKLFLDSSSLFKLYHNAPGAEEIEYLFSQARITSISLSEITKIEFASTVWKKVRKQDITEALASKLPDIFNSDFNKFIFVGVDNIIIEQAD